MEDTTVLESLSLKKIIALLLVATLALLATLPQVGLASDRGIGSDNAHKHPSHHGDHSETGDHDEGENQENESEFHIRLLGSQQVPAVNTTSFGFAKVELVDNSTLEFKVVVCDIANVTHSHIHVGAAGTNGPIIIHFFDNSTSPFSSIHGCSTLAEGTRTPSDLTPAGGVNTWNDFVNALLSGNTYINVHTTVHQGGEIRGQLTPHNGDEQEEQSDD